MTDGAQGAVEANFKVWLRAKIAELLKVPIDAVVGDVPLQELGMNSALALSLVQALSSHLGRQVAATLPWTCPTVDQMSAWLATGKGPEARSLIARRRADEPIAIIGASCRLPGGISSPAALWLALEQGVDAIREVPPERERLRPDHCRDAGAVSKASVRRGGFLEQVDAFDPAFFGISAREAREMDPQQRLFLEAAWESLEDAGIAPSSLSGSPVGVFVGAVWSDYARIDGATGRDYTAHTATGRTDNSIISARLSFFLGLQGPSLTLNTACSSSLVAVGLACDSLRSGHCELAIAGGVNVILSPDVTVAISKLGALSPDGHSGAFGAGANGFVRSEGVGAVVLKPLSRAIAGGDPIYAVVRGVAINNDGRSNGLTAPNPLAQQAVVRRAWGLSRVETRAVQYVEAHGTGTPLGDPIEAQALGAVFSDERAAGDTLRLGSLKSNLGHTEGAAGIAGLLKVALSLDRGALPRTLHADEPNPLIDFERLRLHVQRSHELWPEAKRIRAAGVSSFGWGGTNCHAALTEAPGRSAFALALAGRDMAELAATITEVHARLAQARSEPGLRRLCSEFARRATGPHRVAIVADSGQALVTKLAALTPEAFVEVQGRPAVVFVCPGQGGQWQGMAHGLLASEPVFAAKVKECDAVIQRLEGWSVLEHLMDLGRTGAQWERTDIVQPLLLCFQLGVAALWQSWGVRPDAVIGISMGEIVAAHLAGVLPLDEACRVVCTGSRITREMCAGRGGMAVVRLPAEGLRRALDDSWAGQLACAGELSPNTTVVSGDAPALEDLLARLEKKQVWARRIDVDHASHCHHMDTILGALVSALGRVDLASAQLRMWSNVKGDWLGDATCDAEYWALNLRRPFRFTDAVAACGRLNPRAVLVELGPHPTVLNAVESVDRFPGIELVGSCWRGGNESRTLLEAARKLYSHGFEIDWARALGQASERDSQGLLLLSARSNEALRQQAARLADHLEGSPGVRLSDVGHTLAAGRAHFRHRLALVARDATEATGVLRQVASSGTAPEATLGEVHTGDAPVAMLFTGQGSQYPSMGLGLYRSEPVFREQVDRGARALRALGSDISLVEILHGQASSGKSIDDTAATQPALFVLELALFELWRSLGVEPGAVLGHSIGEYAGACAAGVLSFEDGLRLVEARGRLMGALPRDGAMVQLETDEASVRTALGREGSRLSIAAVNGPRSVVISGETGAVEAVARTFAKAGVQTQRLRTSHAFHSPLLRPMLDDFRQVAKRVAYSAPRCALVSNVLGTISSSELTDPEYWVEHVLAPVRFAQGVTTLLERGFSTFLEVGPHPVLTGFGRQCAGNRSAEWLPSLRREQDDRRVLFGSLGRLYARGAALVFDRIHKSEAPRRLRLPTYPFERTRHWIDSSSTDRPRASEPQTQGPLGARVSLPEEVRRDVWTQTLSPERADLGYLTEHRVDGQAIVPACYYIELGQQCLAQKNLAATHGLADMSFERALMLSDTEEHELQTHFRDPDGVGVIEVHARSKRPGDSAGTWKRLARARVVAAPKAEPMNLDAWKQECRQTLSSAEFYARCAEQGNDWGGVFRSIQEIRRGPGSVLVRLKAPPQIAGELERHRFHPALADAALHALTLCVGDWQRWMPFVGERLASARVFGPVPNELWSHLRLRTHSDDRLVVDARVTDLAGAPVAEFLGLTIYPLEVSRKRAATAQPDRWTYHLQWGRAETPPATARSAASTTWLVFHGDSPLGAALSQRLASPNDRVVRIGALGSASVDERVDIAQPAAVEHLVERLLATGAAAAVECVLLPEPAGSARDLPADAVRACEHLLSTARARQGDRVSRHQGGAWIVTQQGQAVLPGEDEAARSAVQASLWGLTRSLMAERPNLVRAVIDLPEEAGDAEAGLLAGIMMAGRCEPQLALRRGAWWAPRLAPRLTKPVPPSRPLIRAASTYLITGGFGALGMLFARWLVEQGARSLILLGRRALPPRAAWATLTGDEAARAQAVRDLEAAGAKVHLAAVDVASRVDLEQFVNTFAAERWPEIRGVIHAAGVIERCATDAMHREHLERAFAAKAAGAWNLNAVFPPSRLDFLALFSSASATFESASLGAYAAANAYLEGMAHARAQSGGSALSLGWGYWPGLGMAREIGLDSGGSEGLPAGVWGITPELGTELFARALAADPKQPPNWILWGADWKEWRRAHPSASAKPWLGDVVEASEGAEAEESLSRAQLEALPEGERPARVSAFVRGVLARILGLEVERIRDDERLTDLGLDSIIAVELRSTVATHLDVDLPVMKLLSGASTVAIVKHILDHSKQGAVGAAKDSDAAWRRIVTSAAKTGPSTVSEKAADELGRMLRGAHDAEGGELRTEYLRRSGIVPMDPARDDGPHAFDAAEGLVARSCEVALGTRVLDMRQAVFGAARDPAAVAGSAQSLCEQIQQQLGIEVEPWLPYATHNVRQLAHAVTSLARRGATTAAAPLLRWEARHRCRARLLCFPFGGGSASVYQKWSDCLPDWLELCAVEPPGRGHRMFESPWTNQTDLDAALEHVLGAELDVPLVFYGHSAGAYMAFAAAQWCRRVQRRLPLALMIGGFWGPTASRASMIPDDVSDEALLEFYRGFGGFSESVLGERDLLPARLPALRADVALVRSYVFDPAPLAVPVCAFAGENDGKVPRQAVAEWARATACAFELWDVPGGHFFLDEQRDAVTRRIAAWVEQQLGR
jgi:acyl transferase domain-containing protein/surfactin synthase thioesterase subunit/acyl carrier protein